MKQALTVGEVSARSGLAISTIHFYESRGLIQCWRNPGNHRRYSRDILRKLAVIKVAQKAGIPLRVIKNALATLPDQNKITANDWAKLAEYWRLDLDDRIRRLSRLRDRLGYCIGCGCLSVKDCELMNPGDQLGSKGSGPRLLDPDP